MVADNSIYDYKKYSNVELDDLVIQKLERYADYLQRQLDIKKIGQVRGDYSQLDHLTQMAELEQMGCPNED